MSLRGALLAPKQSPDHAGDCFAEFILRLSKGSQRQSNHVELQAYHETGAFAGVRFLLTSLPANRFGKIPSVC